MELGTTYGPLIQIPVDAALPQSKLGGLQNWITVDAFVKKGF